MKKVESFTSFLLKFMTFMISCGLLVVIYFFYVQARGLGWQFDDYLNLKGLAAASDGFGVAEFVFGGNAGPLGRPLSLASFLINYDDLLNNNPWGFVHITIIIHLMNVALAGLISTYIFRAINIFSSHQIIFMAMLVAFCWGIAPINASGILMSVQRMTILSAFFQFSAIYAYLIFRSRYQGVPNGWAAIALIAVVLVFLMLSIFSKESGVVGFGIIGLLELILFKNRWEDGKRWWIVLVICALLLVPVALAYHFFSNIDGIRWHFKNYRGYDFVDQIATQLVISWEYMRQIIIPRSSILGPYHDGHEIYGWGSIFVYISLGAWVALLLASISLVKSRGDQKKKIIGLFLLLAALWFWISQQVESTVIPLELYFEHRNYVAALGVFIAAVGVIGYVWQLGQRRKAIALVSGGYVVYLLFSLWQTTTLWGNPMMAAEMWHFYQPKSTRAVQGLAREYQDINFIDASIKLVDDFQLSNPAADLTIQFFPVYCKFEPANQQVERFSGLRERISEMRALAGLVVGLAGMGKGIREGDCAGISVEDYRNFLIWCLSLDKISGNQKIRHHFNYELALVELSLHDVLAYYKYARASYYDFPSISMAESIASVLVARGDLEMSIDWIDDFLATLPKDGANYQRWRLRMTSLRQAIIDINNSAKAHGLEVLKKLPNE